VKKIRKLLLLLPNSLVPFLVVMENMKESTQKSKSYEIIILYFVRKTNSQGKKLRIGFFSLYKFITFTFLKLNSPSFKNSKRSNYRSWDFLMFSTYSKGTNTQNFAKKTIKKLLQKNRKITKNLKCKMKKMTHPPINLLLQLLPFMVRPPNKNKKTWNEEQ
jgi:hypothetical protein